MSEKKVHTYIEERHLGDLVICDICSADWSNRPESGGFLFISKAVCPDCADRMLKSIKSYVEESYIKEFCPPSKSYAQWVREDLRNGEPAVVKITTLRKE